METHSSILAWRIPWTEEPGWLQSMGSQGVGHDWTTDTDAPTVRDTYKLRKNQTPVALGLTAEHGSLSWKSVQNQLYLRSLRECFTWAPSPLLVLGCPSVATHWSLSWTQIDTTSAMLTSRCVTPLLPHEAQTQTFSLIPPSHTETRFLLVFCFFF